MGPPSPSIHTSHLEDEAPEGAECPDEDEPDLDEDREGNALALVGGWRADIVFSRPGHRIPPRPTTARPVASPPPLTYWLRWGAVPYEADPLLRARLERQESWLKRVAEALVDFQRDSLLGTTAAEVFEALTPWTQKAMASRVRTTPEELSRNSWRVLATAGGARVPLALFWSKKPDQADLLGPIRAASASLAAQAGVASAELARLHARGTQIDRLRKMLPALRAVATRPDVIRRHRRLFPLIDIDAALTELGLGSADRGSLVVLLAIVGFIGPPGAAP